MRSEELKSNIAIGIIGAGLMGRLYAELFLKAGWKNINICDHPSKYSQIQSELGDKFNVMRDGYEVSRMSDYIIYSVEAENISKVVSEYGRATKFGAIVGGQTSVKAPEIQAFEKFLPPDVHIITCHSLHGPSIDPMNQPLVVIRHRSSDEKYHIALSVLCSLKSQMVFLTAEEHDRITADTQAVTHVAFLSMGTAWKTEGTYPWESITYVGGIENVKTNMALRLYSNKWHVYGGLALLNPFATPQVKQYASSVSELFTLMIQDKEKEFIYRIKQAAQGVFGTKISDPILLPDALLDKFSLSSIPVHLRKPNSHLSLLAMVDCWYRMGINPYDHMVCQTPPFRLWLGITEYLFKNKDLLAQSLYAAIHDKDIRASDLCFYSATLGWAQCIELGNLEAYRLRFEDTARFFSKRADEGKAMSTKLISTIIKNIQRM